MPTDPASSPAHQLLKPLVNGQDATKSNAGGIDVTKVVSELSDAARAAENNVEDFVYKTWTDLFEIAGQIDYGNNAAQDDLVKVLSELRGTSVTGSGGKTLAVKDAGEVWNDLPTFGWVAREIWNFGECAFSGLTSVTYCSLFLSRQLTLDRYTRPGQQT